MMRKPCDQELEASLTLHTRKERMMNADLLVVLSFLCSLRPQAHGIMLLTFRIPLPTSINHTSIIPHRHIWRISEVRLDPVRLIVLTSQWFSVPSACLSADTQYETQTLKVGEKFGDLSWIFHEQRQRNQSALSASCTSSSVLQAQALGTNHDFLYL